MKDKLQADKLLQDVLDETASPDFREELLHKRFDRRSAQNVLAE